MGDEYELPSRRLRPTLREYWASNVIPFFLWIGLSIAASKAIVSLLNCKNWPALLFAMQASGSVIFVIWVISRAFPATKKKRENKISMDDALKKSIAGSFEKSGDELADIAVASQTEFVVGVLSLYATWALLYSVMLISFATEDRTHISPPWVRVVSTALNNAGTVAALFCYSVMQFKESKGPDGVKGESAQGLVPAQFMWIVFTLVHICYRLVVGTDGPGFELVSGVAAGLVYASWFGKFDSKFVDANPWSTGLLYLYALIQPFWFIVDETKGVSVNARQIKITVLVLAMISKGILAVFLAWVVDTGRLQYYLASVRSLHGKVAADWCKIHGEGQIAESRSGFWIGLISLLVIVSSLGFSKKIADLETRPQGEILSIGVPDDEITLVPVQNALRLYSEAVREEYFARDVDFSLNIEPLVGYEQVQKALDGKYGHYSAVVIHDAWLADFVSQSKIMELTKLESYKAWVSHRRTADLNTEWDDYCRLPYEDGLWCIPVVADVQGIVEEGAPKASDISPDYDLSRKSPGGLAFSVGTADGFLEAFWGLYTGFKGGFCVADKDGDVYVDKKIVKLTWEWIKNNQAGMMQTSDDASRKEIIGSHRIGLAWTGWFVGEGSPLKIVPLPGHPVLKILAFAIPQDEPHPDEVLRSILAVSRENEFRNIIGKNGGFPLSVPKQDDAFVSDGFLRNNSAQIGSMFSRGRSVPQSRHWQAIGKELSDALVGKQYDAFPFTHMHLSDAFRTDCQASEANKAALGRERITNRVTE